MIKAIRTPVRLPKKLKDELDKAIILDGYGFKGRSLWVNDAIEKLLVIDTFYDLVILDDELHGAFVPDSFSLSRHIRDLLDDAIVLVRKNHPSLNAVVSAIVRTAIMQKLIR